MPSWLGDDLQRQFVALGNRLVDLSDLSNSQLQVIENSPEWFSIVVLPYDYDPAATCPRWQQFVHEVMEGDEQRMALMQEFFGYCLTRDMQQQKFLVLEGDGDNRKSVTLEMLTHMIGEQNVSQVPLELFGARFQLTRSIGKLANICAEVGELSTVAEGVLKQFTAGDRMYFDRKGISGIECYPTAKLVLATNNRPRFRDRSEGIWRRMILLPFRYTVPAEKKDRHLTTKLKAELPGIFLWAVEGLRRLRANGRFTEPAACGEVLDEYRLESNPARVFLNENMIVIAGRSVRCADLYSNYAAWAKQHGFEALNSAQFGKEVAKRFPSVERTRMTQGVPERGPTSGWSIRRTFLLRPFCSLVARWRQQHEQRGTGHLANDRTRVARPADHRRSGNAAENLAQGRLLHGGAWSASRKDADRSPCALSQSHLGRLT